MQNLRIVCDLARCQNRDIAMHKEYQGKDPRGFRVMREEEEDHFREYYSRVSLRLIERN